ncbi:MAG: SDR family NAD(P)-dependent oxidoreductase [Anaeroplasma sp.]
MYKDYVYIVTGCTGYVGNVLTKKLLSEGCKVIGFARSFEKADKVFKDIKPTLIYGDISRKEDVKRLFSTANNNYVIIHTVAKVTIGEGSKKELYDVTVGGTSNVVNECIKHNVKKLLHISSTEALPHNLALKSDLSNYIPNPKKVRKGYSRAKSIADKIVLDACINSNLNASILFLAGVLGPGDYSNSHMSQMFIDYIEGKLPASVKGGYNDFDIRDVADVLPTIIEKAKNKEAYLFANKPDQINDILSIIAKKLNCKKLVTLPLFLAYIGLPFLFIWSKITGRRPLYTSTALASLRAKTDFPIEKAKKEFGYNPRELSETVNDHIDFLIENNMVKL